MKHVYHPLSCGDTFNSLKKKKKENGEKSSEEL